MRIRDRLRPIRKSIFLNEETFSSNILVIFLLVSTAFRLSFISFPYLVHTIGNFPLEFKNIRNKSHYPSVYKYGSFRSAAAGPPDEILLLMVF